MLSVRSRPRTPLVAINGAQFAVLGGKVGVGGYPRGKFFDAFALVVGRRLVGFERPIVPDTHPVLGEVFNVRGALEEPKQFVENALDVNLFGGEQGEPRLQIKTHLVAKNTSGARASAVTFVGPLFEDSANEVMVLLHGLKIRGKLEEILFSFWSHSPVPHLIGSWPLLFKAQRWAEFVRCF